MFIKFLLKYLGLGYFVDNRSFKDIKCVFWICDISGFEFILKLLLRVYIILKVIVFKMYRYMLCFFK